jgi:Aerotolerance regulator N-terminal
MDVSLLNAGLAAGTALAAAPVILHLFMRPTPKRVIFPALQLVRQRQKRSRKKLRIKNWLLLLARMALLALMAIALARPTLVSEASVGDQDVPAAIALVFDTSLSMGYTERDKTRLDEAREFAYEVLAKTPGNSMVYVIDSAEPGVPPALSPASARKRIEGLTLRTIARPLNAAVGQAYAAIADVDRPLHQVIVLTDLARSAWDTERTVEGLDKKAKDKKGVKTFVLRLAPKDVRDVAVVAAEPASEVVTEGEPLEVRARIRSLGPATTRVAELWLDGVSRGKKPVDLPANGEADVRFSVAKVDAASRLHQGEVRISGAPDPLAVDDVRFFTFHVKPATRVLVVSDQAIDSQLIADAIDPDPATLPAGVARPYRVERIKTGAFLDHADNLSKRYRCIFVNNVAELSDVEWGKLSGFVADGGGLVVGLGPAVRLDRYQGATAAQVLPASLEKLSPGKETIRFAPAADYTHPLFQKYPRRLDEMLTQTPISRYWVVAPREGARVLLSYTDKSPALVERVFPGSKTGRVLLWTTPLSRRPESNSKDAWNDWPVVGWSYFYLMNQSVAYLAGTTEDVTDFEAGRDVVIPLDPTRRATNYTVQGPNKSSYRLSPPGTSDSLVIVAPQQIGQWTVHPSPDETTGDVIGFSINVPASETQFVALEESDLPSLFGGKDACVLAQNPEDLRIKVNIAKVGHELFPWVMLAILVVVTLENYLANRFYRVAAPRPATA